MNKVNTLVVHFEPFEGNRDYDHATAGGLRRVRTQLETLAGQRIVRAPCAPLAAALDVREVRREGAVDRDAELLVQLGLLRREVPVQNRGYARDC